METMMSEIIIAGFYSNESLELSLVRDVRILIPVTVYYTPMSILFSLP